MRSPLLLVLIVLCISLAGWASNLCKNNDQIKRMRQWEEEPWNIVQQRWFICSRRPWRKHSSRQSVLRLAMSLFEGTARFVVKQATFAVVFAVDAFRSPHASTAIQIPMQNRSMVTSNPTIAIRNLATVNRYNQITEARVPMCSSRLLGQKRLMLAR